MEMIKFCTANEFLLGPLGLPFVHAELEQIVLSHCLMSQFLLQMRLLLLLQSQKA